MSLPPSVSISIFCRVSLDLIFLREMQSRPVPSQPLDSIIFPHAPTGPYRRHRSRVRLRTSLLPIRWWEWARVEEPHGVVSSGEKIERTGERIRNLRGRMWARSGLGVDRGRQRCRGCWWAMKARSRLWRRGASRRSACRRQGGRFQSFRQLCSLSSWESYFEWALACFGGYWCVGCVRVLRWLYEKRDMLQSLVLPCCVCMPLTTAHQTLKYWQVPLVGFELCLLHSWAQAETYQPRNKAQILIQKKMRQGNARGKGRNKVP